MRAMTSVGPPGGNPTTTRTGRFGYPCADDAATPDSDNAAASNMRKTGAMAFSLDMFWLRHHRRGRVTEQAQSDTRAKQPGRPPLFLQQRFDFLVHVLERHRALQPLAIDEEGRR